MFVSGIEGSVALPKNTRIDFVCFFDNINLSLLIINAYYMLISENCKLGFQFKHITNTQLPFTKRTFFGLYDFLYSVECSMYSLYYLTHNQKGESQSCQ